jgi:hypothetical protein
MPMCGCRSAGSARRRQGVPGASEDRLCRTLAAPSSRSHARSVVRGRALAASPGAPLTWVACRQDCGHQMLQRADEVLLAHQDGAVAGMDDVDRASWGCPVRRGDGQDLLDEVSQRPASVRLEVSSARRRMLPSQATSVITTLTQTSLPASARETASHLWQRHECRKVQRDPCYALGSPAVVAEHPRMRVTPNRARVWCLSFPGKGGHRTPSSGLAQLPHTGPASLLASRPVPGETALGAAVGVGVAVVVCCHDQAVIRARSATSWRR